MLRFRHAARGACRVSNVLSNHSLSAASALSSKRFDFVPRQSLSNAFSSLTPSGESPLYAHRTIPPTVNNFDIIPTIDDTINTRDLNVKPLSTFPIIRKRISLTGRINSGIQKRRTIRSFLNRGYATEPGANKGAPVQASAASTVISSSSTSSSKTSNEKTSKAPARLTWRDATKSPIKAMRYANQLRIDLVDWFKHMWAGAKLLAVS